MSSCLTDQTERCNWCRQTPSPIIPTASTVALDAQFSSNLRIYHWEDCITCRDETGIGRCMRSVGLVVSLCVLTTGVSPELCLGERYN